MKALRDHFSGEGNTSRNIAEAERLRDTLHYKNERAMQFETFLTNMEKMFNIFEKEDEPMKEDAKLRMLFQKVQHLNLQKTVEALKVQQRTDPNKMTYTIAANHLATSVSELPEHISRRTISGVASGSASSIYKDDGSIKTGEIDGWASISYEDKQKVWAERRRLNIRFTPKYKSKNKKYLRQGDTSPSDKNRLKQLSEQNLKYKRKIKSLSKVSFEDDEDKPQSKNEEDIDAGDQFGGKASKKNKRD